jgi:hypothetical protein
MAGEYSAARICACFRRKTTCRMNQKVLAKKSLIQPFNSCRQVNIAAWNRKPLPLWEKRNRAQTQAEQINGINAPEAPAIKTRGLTVVRMGYAVTGDEKKGQHRTKGIITSDGRPPGPLLVDDKTEVIADYSKGQEEPQSGQDRPAIDVRWGGYPSPGISLYLRRNLRRVLHHCRCHSVAPPSANAVSAEPPQATGRQGFS